MAISRVTGQDAKATGSSTPLTATYASTPTQGNLLIASAYANISTDVLAISGWTKVGPDLRGANNGSLFYKIAGAAESKSVQLTGGTPTQVKLHIYEYTGNVSASPLDTSNTGHDTAGHTTWASPSITTANASDLLFIAEYSSATITNPSFDSSFNLRQVDTSIRLFDGDRIVATTGTYSTTASWTTSSQNGAVIAAFKATPVTGSATLSGAGSLTSTGVHTGVGSAAPAGTGSLTATGSHTGIGMAALAGSGALAATGTRKTFAAATLAGSGAATATGTHTALGATSLTGTGTAAATGIHIGIGAASLTGIGAATATGTHTGIGTATLTGTGNATATGLVVGIDSAEISGNGTLAASGFKTVHAVVALPGSGSLAATATRHRFATAVTQGTGGLTATGRLAAFGAGVLTASGSLSATGTDIAPALPYGQLPDRWFPDTALVGIASAPSAVIGIARPPGRSEP